MIPGTHSDNLLMSAFVSLTQALEDWFDQPLAQLPDELRLRVEDEFLPMPWDRLTAAGRRDVTKQVDFRVDPATEAYRHTSWDYAERRSDLEARIKVWQDSATPTATDLKHQAENIQSLQRELTDLEAEFKVKLDGFDENGHHLPAAGTHGHQRPKVVKSDLTADLPAHQPNHKDGPRKRETQDLHKKWQSEYRRLKKSKPNMSDTWYAQKIEEGPHAQGRSADTIRKNMKR